jgi:hypothetical protein
MAEYNDPKLDAWGPETSITTARFTSNQVRVESVPVRSNLTNGQLWGVDPIPTRAVSGYEPLWESDDDSPRGGYSAPLRPDPLWRSAEDDNNAPLRTKALWESDDDDVFDGRPREELLWDSGGQAWRPLNEVSSAEKTETNIVPNPGSETSPNIEQQTQVTPPPPEPSTRPYIWSYKNKS